jgi:tRNA modification GTPase
VPGTTRDVVTVTLAFDGWPVEVSDTAGLREAPDELEREGIARARQTIAESDLCLWLLDTTTQPVGPTLRLVDEIGASREKILFVLNKIDLPPTWDPRDVPQAVRVSAVTAEGIEELIQRMLARLVPITPPPGAAVPYSPERCDCVEETYRLIREGQMEKARQRLLAA